MSDSRASAATRDSTAFAPAITVLVRQPPVLAPPDLSLEAVMNRFPGLAAAEAVCVTGSTAAGWGNVYSDIDVFAFADEELELPMDETAESFPSTDPSGITWMNWIGAHGDRRVDMQVWPTETLERALKKFLTSPEPELCGVSERLQDIIYRSSIGRPLVNEAFFRRLHEMLAASSYHRALARSLKVKTEICLLDVAGQLASDDAVTARLSAARAATLTVDSCLVLAGEICRGDKWLLRRLEQTPECGITVEEFMEEVLNGPRDGESDGDYALRVARWTQSHFNRLEDAILVKT